MDYFDHLELRVGQDVLWVARSVAVPAAIRKHRLGPGDTRLHRVLSLRGDPVALRRFCARALDHLQIGRLTDAQLVTAVQSEIESGRLCGLLLTLGDAHTAQARVEAAASQVAPPPRTPAVPPVMPGATAKPTTPISPVTMRGQQALRTTSATGIVRPAKLDVANMELEDRFMEVVSRAIDKTPGEAGRALKELLTSESLAMMALIAGGMVVAYGLGVGAAATVALLAWAYWEGGKAAVAAIGDVVAFLTVTYSAKDEDDLEEASDALSRAAIALVQVGIAVLLHRMAARKTGPNKPKPVERRGAPRNPEVRRPLPVEEEAAAAKPKAAAAPTPAQSQTAKRLGVDPKWVEPNGDVRWPPNDGFNGPPTQTTLQPGTRIDRYGSPNGKYLSPAGTPFDQRALPPSSASKPPTQYEVLKPIETSAGEAAPWFDKPGGGTQYKMNKSVQDLIDDGYLREVK